MVRNFSYIIKQYDDTLILGTWSFGIVNEDFDNISFYDSAFGGDIENELEKKDLFQDYDDSNGEIVANKKNAIKMDKYIQEVCCFNS